MPSSERIKGSDCCSIQRFDGLPGKSNEVKQTSTTSVEPTEDSVIPSFQTIILIKEDI